MNLSLKTKCGHTLAACLASCRHERLCATPSLHPNDTFLHSAEAMGLDVPRRTSLLAVTFFLNFRWMEVSSRTPSRAPLSLLGVNSFSINRMNHYEEKEKTFAARGGRAEGSQSPCLPPVLEMAGASGTEGTL